MSGRDCGRDCGWAWLGGHEWVGVTVSGHEWVGVNDCVDIVIRSGLSGYELLCDVNGHECLLSAHRSHRATFPMCEIQRLLRAAVCGDRQGLVRGS